MWKSHGITHPNTATHKVEMPRQSLGQPGASMHTTGIVKQHNGKQKQSHTSTYVCTCEMQGPSGRAGGSPCSTLNITLLKGSSSQGLRPHASSTTVMPSDHMSDLASALRGGLMQGCCTVQ